VTPPARGCLRAEIGDPLDAKRGELPEQATSSELKLEASHLPGATSGGIGCIRRGRLWLRG